jgi:hypothetical protein
MSNVTFTLPENKLNFVFFKGFNVQKNGTYHNADIIKIYNLHFKYFLCNEYLTFSIHTLNFC